MIGLIHKIRKSLTGIIPAGERMHPEFQHEISGGWHINYFMKNRSIDVPFPKPDSLKIRILLNEDDIKKLDSCPFMAKLGLSVDKSAPYKYCAFIYPRGNEIESIRAWVKTRNFPIAEIFTYGYFAKGGQWTPGTQMGTV